MSRSAKRRALPRETGCGECGGLVWLPRRRWEIFDRGAFQRVVCPACGGIVVAISGPPSWVAFVAELHELAFDELPSAELKPRPRH